MMSMQVGLLANLKGKLIKRRYRTAVIFFDNFFWLEHIHLMTNITSEKTVMAKKA